MKKAVITVLSVLLALILIAGAIVGISLVHKYMPSREVTKETDWYGVSGDEIALVYRDVRQDAAGIYDDGQIYLPLEWVVENINERFYWDSGGRQLIYTLPESIVYAGLETTGASGAKLIMLVGEDVYLLGGIIAAYTDVRMDLFTDTEAKRLFIDDRWQEEMVAAINKETAVREKGGVKSAILTTLARDEKVTILNTMDHWSEVRTADGFVGYLENKRLGESTAENRVSTFEAPVYTSISMDEEISLVWHQMMNTDANDKLNQMLVNVKGINVLAPTWFMLTDNSGNYDSLASKKYVDEAHERGIQVWAVVDNFNRGDNVRSEILFADTAARKQLVENLMADAAELGLDGINMDVEGIRPEAGPHYVQFIRELSIACRREGIVLSVDTYVPTVSTAFYNRAELGAVADYVAIMAYDEHHDNGVMGSVSSIDYVKKGIADTLKDVPKEKLICGLPFYTRLWQEEDGKVTSKALGIIGAADWINQNNVELYWQEALEQYYGEKTDGNIKYTIWMEETQSLAKKLEAVRAQGLAGTAYWKLGLEPAEIWDVVKP